MGEKYGAGSQCCELNLIKIQDLYGKGFPVERPSYSEGTERKNSCSPCDTCGGNCHAGFNSREQGILVSGCPRKIQILGRQNPNEFANKLLVGIRLVLHEITKSLTGIRLILLNDNKI